MTEPGGAGGAEAGDLLQLEAVVRGLVQGVNFRHYARQAAQHLGLAGYVQNLSDGTVYVLAQGHRAALLALLDWLMRGPSMAEVSGVDERWGQVSSRYGSFEVRY